MDSVGSKKSKICTKCNNRKKLEFFVRNKACPDGTENECKLCAKLRKTKHREDNIEQYKAREKAYAEANKENIRLVRKAYYKANKDRILTQTQEYREQHSAHLKRKAREWAKANAALISKRRKAYYEANKERILAKTKQLRRTSPERFKTYHKTKYAKHRDCILRKTKEYRKTHKKEHNASGKKARLELADHYVRWLLCSNKNGPTILSADDIHQELVDAKREHIRLGRLLKGMQA